jgi:hypothetical protein
VDDALEKLLAARGQPQRGLRRPGGNMAYYLHRYAGIFKDASFAEESEWRLISRPLSCTVPQYAYRPGKSTVTPYYRFPLAQDEVGHLKLKEIVVGPSPHPNLAERSVHSLLVKHDLHDGALGEGEGVPVRLSTVPYRNW